VGAGFQQVSKVGEEQGDAGGDDKNEQCEPG
jgi:hypothetical protein